MTSLLRLLPGEGRGPRARPERRPAVPRRTIACPRLALHAAGHPPAHLRRQGRVLRLPQDAWFFRSGPDPIRREGGARASARESATDVERRRRVRDLPGAREPATASSGAHRCRSTRRPHGRPSCWSVSWHRRVPAHRQKLPRCSAGVRALRRAHQQRPLCRGCRGIAPASSPTRSCSRSSAVRSVRVPHTYATKPRTSPPGPRVRATTAHAAQPDTRVRAQPRAARRRGAPSRRRCTVVRHGGQYEPPRTTPRRLCGRRPHSSASGGGCAERWSPRPAGAPSRRGVGLNWHSTSITLAAVGSGS
jgi:hypothetical protein